MKEVILGVSESGKYITARSDGAICHNGGTDESNEIGVIDKKGFLYKVEDGERIDDIVGKIDIPILVRIKDVKVVRGEDSTPEVMKILAIVYEEEGCSRKDLLKYSIHKGDFFKDSEIVVNFNY